MKLLLQTDRSKKIESDIPSKMEGEEIFSLRLSRYDRDAISIGREKGRKKEDWSGVQPQPS